MRDTNDLKRLNNNRKKRKAILRLLLTILLLALLIIPFFILKHIINNKKEQQLLKENYSVLKELENRQIEDVEKELYQKQNKKSVDNSKDSRGSNLNNEKNLASNKVFFEDSVFMGDSLTEALDFYSLLNPSSVLAKKGQNVVQAKGFVPQLVNLKPRRIFLRYGSNDLEFFSNVNDFEKNYINLIKSIKEKLPNSEIYIQSITPITPKAQQKNPMLANDRFNLFSEALKKIADKEKVHYLDITPVISGRNNLYEPDGIHFKVEFYTLLLKFIRDNL